MALQLENLNIRCYDTKIDRTRVEELEKKCEVGPSGKASLFTDTLGDPICRIRNSPSYKMLVAELNNELIGLVQGSIKMVTICTPIKDRAIVGYILGLRVSPRYRRKGIGSRLVRCVEEWFMANHVDFAYMATEKDNEASVKLFKEKLGFINFRAPSILVNPVSNRSLRVPNNVEILKLTVEQAEKLYRRVVASSTEFFPNDIDWILRNKLSLGTWVAFPRGESWSSTTNGSELSDCGGGGGDVAPTNWAMVSVWNSGQLFKLRVGKAPISCLLYSKGSSFINQICPCLKIKAIPDLFEQFGFYFMYGVHGEGLTSGFLFNSLCRFVHNMARKEEECKLVVTEIGECSTLRFHIPHARSLSCTEDFWCIKALKNEAKNLLFELTSISPPASLFVDPREV